MYSPDGEKIKRLRKKCVLTQSEIVESINSESQNLISLKSYQNLEMGVKSSGKMLHIVAIYFDKNIPRGEISNVNDESSVITLYSLLKKNKPKESFFSPKELTDERFDYSTYLHVVSSLKDIQKFTWPSISRKFIFDFAPSSYCSKLRKNSSDEFADTELKSIKEIMKSIDELKENNAKKELSLDEEFRKLDLISNFQSKLNYLRERHGIFLYVGLLIMGTLQADVVVNNTLTSYGKFEVYNLEDEGHTIYYFSKDKDAAKLLQYRTKWYLQKLQWLAETTTNKFSHYNLDQAEKLETQDEWYNEIYNIKIDAVYKDLQKSNAPIGPYGCTFNEENIKVSNLNIGESFSFTMKRKNSLEEGFVKSNKS